MNERCKGCMNEVESIFESSETSRVQGLEGFSESVKRNSLSVEYILSVQGGQAKGLFKFKKRIPFNLKI